MLSGSTSRDFVGLLGGALAEAGRRNIRVTAGAGACDLEAQHILPPAPDDQTPGPPAGPRHLEGEVGSVDPGGPDAYGSRLCYFLDGVQATHEVGRVGPVPVVVTTVAAAVVERCERRFRRVELGGPPAVARAVILPLGTGDEKVAALHDLLVGEGLAEVYEESPITSPDLILDSTEYVAAPDPADYVGMKALAFGRARSLRERLEGQLLDRWGGDDRVLDSDDWIAVDGQLRTRVEMPPPRAVGLIKSVARPEFVGEDVNVLLDLAPGKRTTSFVPGWQLSRAAADQRCSWYVRMWPQQRGADPLGSLMRIEAHSGTGPEEVDRITRWVLAERAPIAKPDPRWPAMIYPIHHIEKMLKPLVRGSERAYSRLERQFAAAPQAPPTNGRN